MKLGVLEYRDDNFMNDVMARLPGSEFVKFGVTDTPLEKVYDVLIDRLSFHSKFFGSIVKMYSMKGTYVINNPFSTSCDDKCLQNQICERLGIPVPKTMLLPQLSEDVDFADIIKDIDWSVFKSFPIVIKPYDGYAWEDIFIARSSDEVKNIAHAVGERRLLIAQDYIEHDIYLRCFCINKSDILIMRYDPEKKAYLKTAPNIGGLRDQLTEWMIKFNEAVDYDINTVEWAIKGGKPFMIDALNEVPEVLPHSIPGGRYKWIVDKFVECVNDKFGKRNRTIFGPF